jgi:hypothetical protein
MKPGIKLLILLGLLVLFDLSAQSSGYYQRLYYRMDDPFVFCTQGQDVRRNPAPCWKPMPPFTGAYMLMPYCRPPNPYGKNWTQDDTLSFRQYLSVCPQAITSGRWEGRGRPEHAPISH